MAGGSVRRGVDEGGSPFLRRRGTILGGPVARPPAEDPPPAPCGQHPTPLLHLSLGARPTQVLPDPRRKEGLAGPGRQWASDTPQAFTESSHSEGEHPRTPPPATPWPPCPERGCFSWRGLGLPLVAQPTPQILLERTLGRVGSWVGGPWPEPSSAPKSGDWKEQGLYVGAVAPSRGAGPAEPSASRSGLPRGLSDTRPQTDGRAGAPHSAGRACASDSHSGVYRVRRTRGPPHAALWLETKDSLLRLGTALM